jgi:hypothetical protein
MWPPHPSRRALRALLRMRAERSPFLTSTASSPISFRRSTHPTHRVRSWHNNTTSDVKRASCPCVMAIGQDFYRTIFPPQSMNIFLLSHPSEGVIMRRLMMGRDAAPAGSASSARLPGGLGPRSTDTTIRAQGACWTAQAHCLGSQTRPEVSAEGLVPCAKSPRWSARRRAPFRRGRHAGRREPRCGAAWRSIPSDFNSGGKEWKKPGRKCAARTMEATVMQGITNMHEMNVPNGFELDTLARAQPASCYGVLLRAWPKMKPMTAVTCVSRMRCST